MLVHVCEHGIEIHEYPVDLGGQPRGRWCGLPGHAAASAAARFLLTRPDDRFVLGDDGRHRQPGGFGQAVREIFGQPPRDAWRQCRKDDLVERSGTERIGDGQQRPLVAQAGQLDRVMCRQPKATRQQGNKANIDALQNAPAPAKRIKASAIRGVGSDGPSRRARRARERMACQRPTSAARPASAVTSPPWSLASSSTLTMGLPFLSRPLPFTSEPRRSLTRNVNLNPLGSGHVGSTAGSWGIGAAVTEMDSIPHSLVPRAMRNMGWVTEATSPGQPRVVDIQRTDGLESALLHAPALSISIFVLSSK